MPREYHEIEDQIKRLERVDVGAFEDIKSRIRYQRAFVATRKEKLNFLVKNYNYKTALVIDAKYKAELNTLKQFEAFAAEEDLEELDKELRVKGSSSMERDEANILYGISEIEAGIRTILFGIPFHLKLTTHNIIIDLLMPSLTIDKELGKLLVYLEQKKLVLRDRTNDVIIDSVDYLQKLKDNSEQLTTVIIGYDQDLIEVTK